MVMLQRVPSLGLLKNILICSALAGLSFVGCGAPEADPTTNGNNVEPSNGEVANVTPNDNGDPIATPGELPDGAPTLPPEFGNPGPVNPAPEVDLSSDFSKKTPTELLAITEYLEAKLRGLAGRVRSNPIPAEEAQAEHKGLLSQLVDASTKAYESKDATEDQRVEATRVKAESMGELIRYDDRYKEMLKTFMAVAATDANEKIAAMGSVYSFMFSIHDVMRETDPLPPSHLVAMFTRVAENKAIGIGEFVAVDGALNNLSRSHLRETVVPLREKLATVFGNSDDPEVAAAAKELTESLEHQTLMSGLEQHIFSVYQDKITEETPAQLAAATMAIIKATPTGEVFNELSDHSMNLEFSGHPTEAMAINTVLEAEFGDHESPEVQEDVKLFLDEAKKRIGSIGQKLELEGVQLDGSEFNWDSYRGKVVLVDFWASYCRPCIEEMPNVIENYEKYNEKGFEVVGINVDPQITRATDFLQRQKLPWPTIVSKDPTKNDLGSNVNALKYGVIAIPFVVLVDRDGTVINIHLRGEKLGKKLAEIFGEDPQPESENNTAPTGEEKPAENTPPAEKAAPAETTPPAEKAAPAETTDPKKAEAPQAEEVPLELNPPKPEGNSQSIESRDIPTYLVSTVLDNETKPAAADDKDADDKDTDEDAEEKDADEEKDAEEDEDVLKLTENPYLPREDLSDLELLDFLFSMADKPKSIKHRPGYTDAVVVAADRMMKRDTKEKYQVIAAMEKFRVLHWDASFGNEKADKQLMEFVVSMKDDGREKIKNEVEFFQLERRVIDVDEAKLEDVPVLLTELKTFYANAKLTDKHLRIASSTVHAINRLEDSEKREEHFKEFGGIFSESRDRELSRYGKKLAKVKPPAVTDLVGKPLELEGETVDGADFVWDAYRGKVVLVDFWATWCGPCRKEMPHVKQLYNELQDKDFEVVGVSLDQDMEALVTYINENQITWANIAGDKAQEAAQKYGVRGIPTMMVIDAEGNIAGVSHNVGQLKAKIKELLEKE
jgi:thiol-disulfide isomerase/thioredoxin